MKTIYIKILLAIVLICFSEMTSCPVIRMSAVAAPTVQSSIVPNPFTGSFNLTVQESVQSFNIINDTGIVEFTGGGIEEGGTISMGDNFQADCILYVFNM